MAAVDKNSKLPLYYQLVEILVKDIQEGRYLENERIPSERQLCEMYDVSRVTVRHAVNELVSMGLLEKRHGDGTYVAPKLSQDLLGFYSFTDEMKKIGREPWSKVLEFDTHSSEEKIARKLGVEIGSPHYRLVRLRMADDTPMMYERTYLPVERFKGLVREDLEDTPMYDVFRNQFDVSFSKAEEVLKPVTTRDYEAELLEVNQAVPSMMIERTTYEDDEIIEYTISIARGDQFNYRVVLE